MEASWGELAAYVEDGSGTVRLTGGLSLVLVQVSNGNQFLSQEEVRSVE
jgi:hypothetical protein